MSQQGEPRPSLRHRLAPAMWLTALLERLSQARWERWLTAAALLALIALAGARPRAVQGVWDGAGLLVVTARANALQARHPARAAALWQQLRARRPGDLPLQELATSELFRLYRAAGDEARVRTLLAEPTTQDLLRRGAPRLASAVSLALLRGGDAAAAVEVLRPALDRAATAARHRFLALQMADALTRAGRGDEAEPLLVGLQEAAPQDPDLRNGLAYHYAVADQRLDEAEQLLRPALRAQAWNWWQRLLSPAEYRLTQAQYLDTLAWIRYRQDQLQEAKSLLLKAVNQSVDQPQAEILYHLAQVCYDLGDDRPAWDYCQQALAAEPNHPEARRLQGLLEGDQQNHIG